MSIDLSKKQIAVFERCLVVGVTSLFVFVFLKNAWVADDAYIAFRSLEQWFAGNGLRWNIDERVQIYTSPLWFGLLACLRLLSADVFINAIVLSALCCALLLWLAWRLLASAGVNHDSGRVAYRYSALVLLLLSIWCVMDFSSSGLENPLLYILVAAYIYCYSRFFQQAHRCDAWFARLCVVLALMAITRHDMVTLIAMPTLYIVYRVWRNLGLIFLSRYLLLAVLPLIAWSIFSTIYYGLPFPNTAYAKMLHGVARNELMDFGWLYLNVSLRFDYFAALTLLLLLLRVLSARSLALLFLLLGVLSNFAYVVYVGGDFMLGRFVSVALVFAVFSLFAPLPSTLVSNTLVSTSLTKIGAWLSGKKLPLLLGAPALAATLFMNMPLNLPANSGFDIESGQRHYSWQGILNERNFYFKTNSLWAWWHRDETVLFPNHKWCRMGQQAALAGKKLSRFGGIGMYGYCAGLEMIIVDNLALADPFLARLPMDAEQEWRAGHFQRALPAGYLPSRLSRKNLLLKPSLRPLWDDMFLLTSAPLFTKARWQAIWRVNTGYYRGIKP